MKPTETLLQEFRKLDKRCECGTNVSYFGVETSDGYIRCQNCKKTYSPLDEILLETISSTRAERDGEIREKVDALHRAKWDFDNKMIPWEKGYTKACEDVLSLLSPKEEMCQKCATREPHMHEDKNDIFSGSHTETNGEPFVLVEEDKGVTETS